jgi:actin beta/gamma 1
LIKSICLLPGLNLIDRYYGEEAEELRPLFDQRYPVDDGIITNFTDIEWIWDYLYEKRLKAKPEDHPLLLAEPNACSKENREKTVTLLFEQYYVPALYLSMQGVLAIHPSGSSTGVVVDSGTASTYAVPVYEGFALRRGIQRLNIGGRHLTDHFLEGLSRGGNNLGTISERKLARNVKEEYCYVAQDFRRELQLAQGEAPTETSYKLVDGKSITTGRERFMTPEALFHPHLMGMNGEMGIQHLTFGAVLKSDTSLQDRLYGNIVLVSVGPIRYMFPKKTADMSAYLKAGGSTLFPGIQDRMQSEMTGLAPLSAKVNVVASPERKHSSWIGGSMVASLSTFQKMCVQYDEYDEVGPTIVLRRFF